VPDNVPLAAQAGWVTTALAVPPKAAPDSEHAWAARPGRWDVYFALVRACAKLGVSGRTAAVRALEADALPASGEGITRQPRMGR